MWLWKSKTEVMIDRLQLGQFPAVDENGFARHEVRGFIKNDK
jgi:hypothetical protein